MKRIQLEIVLGTLLVLLTTAMVVVLGFREPQRLEQYVVQQRAELIEFGATVFTNNCTSCHGSLGQGVAGVAPSLRDEHFFTERLAEVGWQGGLEDYIISVVTTGRQISTRPQLYVGMTGQPPVMPTWSEKFGGPLRDDQIRAVAAFIMNFEPYALGLVPTAVPLGPVVDESTPEGRGQVVFAAQGCTACHAISGLSTGNVGPVLDGLASRAGNTVAGLSAEEYIHQSIVDPNAYIVPGFAEGIMPQNFAELMSEDQLNDLVAFLLTLE
ncbi:MAG: c-type cytochrome [Anaerolineales bacterium]|nr:c-type cytochrome [Anaerolineales bacterium]MCW5856573.1 c-type cytochrome [Anaerolineales bacterium]